MYLFVFLSLSSLESLSLFEDGNRLSTLLLTVIGVVIGASFYGIGLLKWNVLQKEELDQFFFIRKLKKKAGK